MRTVGTCDAANVYNWRCTTFPNREHALGVDMLDASNRIGWRVTVDGWGEWGSRLKSGGRGAKSAGVQVTTVGRQPCAPSVAILGRGQTIF
jgi:hypothetical protein